jgi:hypothetical protein
MTTPNVVCHVPTGAISQLTILTSQIAYLAFQQQLLLLPLPLSLVLSQPFGYFWLACCFAVESH